MPVTRVPVSVLIPSYNSADVITECLESVSWADEIVVCDSYSTDATLEIARRYTDRIVQHEYLNSAAQKNWAIPRVRHEWVLIVDTDERVSLALRREIAAVLAPDCPYDGFRIARLNHVFGRPIRHGGHYPDYQLRLFRRDRGRYQDRQVHAHVELRGRCGVLGEPLLHFGQRSVEQVTRTYLLRYTAWEAAQKDRDGVRFRPHDLIVRPIGAFAVRYLRQGGFRDGTAGLFMALLVGVYVFLTYARLWQMQSGSRRGRTDARSSTSPGHAGLASIIQERDRQGQAGPGSAGANSAGSRGAGGTPALPGTGPRGAGGTPALPGTMTSAGELTGLEGGPINVAFLAPHTAAGGAETNLRTLAARLDRARVCPRVLVAGEGALTALLDGTGTPVTCVPTPRFFSTSMRLGPRFGRRTVFNPLAVAADCLLLAWAAVAYARAARRERAQVIHTGSIFAHLLGALVAPAAGARLVWHVQDVVSPHLGAGLVLPFFARLGARRADLVICPSQAVADGLRAHWPAAKAGRLRVVHNGVDLSPYDPLLPASPVRQELGILDDAFVAVHVGRLVPWKGQREYLQAARQVAAEWPAARFLVVGDVAFDGPAYREDLHRLARELGLQDRVIFTGWRHDMPALLAAADVLVHSSVSPEPFGLVIVEAMAMRKPVIASAEGGPREIVRDGVEGVLVEPGKPTELAAALLRLAADPDLRARLGHAGRARAESCFGADRFAREMDALLHESVGRRVA